MGFFKTLFGGGGPKQIQTSDFAPEQRQAMNSLMRYIMNELQTKGRYDFEPIAEQAKGLFYDETVPTLAERFTSMGQGAQNSSGFQGALGRAGGNLSQNLAALQSQYNLQRLGGLQALLGASLQPQFNTTFAPARQGLLQQGLGIAGGLAKLF